MAGSNNLDRAAFRDIEEIAMSRCVHWTGAASTTSGKALLMQSVCQRKRSEHRRTANVDGSRTTGFRHAIRLRPT